MGSRLPHQRHLLRKLAHGATIDDLASELHLSREGTKYRLARAREAVDARNVTEAVARGMATDVRALVSHYAHALPWAGGVLILPAADLRQLLELWAPEVRP